MHMPYLSSQASSADMISTFGGYDHNPVISDGEWYDMKNLTSDKYPLAGNRDKRGYPKLKTLLPDDAEIIDICGKDSIYAIYKAPKYETITTSTHSFTKDTDFDATGIPDCIFDDNQYIHELNLSEGVHHDSDSGSGSGYTEYTAVGTQNYRTNAVELSNGIIKLSGEDKNSFNVIGLNIGYATAKASGSYYVYKPSSNVYAVKQYLTHLVDNDGVPTTSALSTLAQGPTVETTELLKSSWLIGKKVSFWWFNAGTIRKYDWHPTITGITAAVSTSYSFKFEFDSDNTCEIANTWGQANFCVTIDIGTDVTYAGTQKEQEEVTGHSVHICKYDTEAEEISNSTQICDYTSGDHQVIEMGAYINIFPEKYQVDTVKVDDYGMFDVTALEHTHSPDKVYAVMTTLDGTALTIKKVSETAPIVKTETTTDTTTSESGTSSTTGTTTKAAYFDGVAWDDGCVWIDTSTDIPTCKKYSNEQLAWATVQPYLTIYTADDHGFEKSDAIQCTFPDKIKECLRPADKQKYYVIAKVSDGKEAFTKTTTTTSDSGVTETSTQSASYYWYRFPVAFKQQLPSVSLPYATGGITGFSAKRTIPDMDYIIECQNRLWGCKYGTDEDGETINEIFASKLADAKNWHYFANTSVDSYYVSLGSDGGFTGAITYQSNPVFFKRDCIHRITGSYPAQYNMNTLEAYGVKDGCSKSVKVMNDIVYYMSPVGMLAYSGSLPQSLAEPFGTEKYSNAISGTVGNRLYVSMQDESENWNLFVFDDSRLCWHKEDDLHVKCFTTFGHECLCVDNDDTLISLTGVYGDKEDIVEWSMVTGEIGYTTPMRKRLLKLILRLKLDINARAKIEIQYDGDGTWRYVNDLRPTGRTGGYSVPVCPTRCDHFAIRISGKGNIDLLSMTKFYVEGSDKN